MVLVKKYQKYEAVELEGMELVISRASDRLLYLSTPLLLDLSTISNQKISPLLTQIST
jgi:hypothetical protein